MESPSTALGVSAVEVWRRDGLEAARQHLGWSQRELANQAGCSHPTIREWEDHGVPAERERAVANALAWGDDVSQITPGAVRLLRRRLRCSSAELADRLGVSRTLVVGWEQDMPIRPRHAQKLLHQLAAAPNLARAARDWHGWTDEELSRELGVSRSRITTWVNGARIISPHAERLIRLLEQDPSPPAAEELLEWRTRRRLGGPELARILGVARARIHAWEAGDSIPKHHRGPLRALMRSRMPARDRMGEVLDLIDKNPGRLTDEQIVRALGRAGATRAAIAALEQRGRIYRSPSVYEDMPGRRRLGDVLYPAGTALVRHPALPNEDAARSRLDGIELKALRERNKISQARLARELNVTREAVRGWEQARYVPEGRQSEAITALIRLREQPNPRRAAPPSAVDGSEVRRRREDAGLTQPELATRLGLARGQAQVSAWERGVARITQATASRISEALAAAAAERVTREDLRAGRKRAGWTQPELARKLGVTHSRVRRWEAGRTKVPSRFWERIRAVLECAPVGELAAPMPDLRGRREALRWSQHELARRVGVWQADVRRWERGSRPPRVIRERIERALLEGAPTPDPSEARRLAIVALINEQPGLSRKKVMQLVGGGWHMVRSDVAALEVAGQLHERATAYVDENGRKRSRRGFYGGPAVSNEPLPPSAEAIVARRKQLGWSQAELARRLGISPTSVHRWERDVVTPDAAQVIHLETTFATAERTAPEGLPFRLSRVGELLRLERERLGSSISEMARLLGVDRGTLAAWESGERPVSVSRRQEVLERLERLESNTGDQAEQSAR